MLAKYVSETEIRELTGQVLRHNGRTYTNPTAEQIREAGYVEVAFQNKMLCHDTASEELALKYENGDPIKAKYIVQKKGN